LFPQKEEEEQSPDINEVRKRANREIYKREGGGTKNGEERRGNRLGVPGGLKEAFSAA
jgi:hypothetical protein